MALPVAAAALKWAAAMATCRLAAAVPAGLVPEVSVLAEPVAAVWVALVVPAGLAVPVAVVMPAAAAVFERWRTEKCHQAAAGMLG